MMVDAGIFTVRRFMTFKRMTSLEPYYSELAEKLKERGYFPETDSRLGYIAVKPQEISFSDMDPSMHTLASYICGVPHASGAFGITHLAQFATRYGFEIVDTPPVELAMESVNNLSRSPRLRRMLEMGFSNTSLEGEDYIDRAISRLKKAAVGVRAVAISKEKLQTYLL